MHSSILPVTTLSCPLVTLVAAPFVGSYLGVLIQRLPAGRSASFARSACETCGVTLAPRDLVPLASYLWLGGKCRHCGSAVGIHHLVIELAAIGVVLWAVMADPYPDQLWADCLLGWTLLALGWIDWRWMLLPDALTLPLVMAGLSVTLLLRPEAMTGHAAGVAIGYFGLCSLGWFYRITRGREGIGGGDAKLFGAAGAWLGVAGLPLVLLLAALLGLAMAGLFVLAGRRVQATTALPFGSCLALAVWLVWLHGFWMVNSGLSIWPG